MIYKQRRILSPMSNIDVDDPDKLFLAWVIWGADHDSEVQLAWSFLVAKRHAYNLLEHSNFEMWVKFIFWPSIQIALSTLVSLFVRRRFSQPGLARPLHPTYKPTGVLLKPQTAEEKKSRIVPYVHHKSLLPFTLKTSMGYHQKIVNVSNEGDRMGYWPACRLLLSGSFPSEAWSHRLASIWSHTAFALLCASIIDRICWLSFRCCEEDLRGQRQTKGWMKRALCKMDDLLFLHSLHRKFNMAVFLTLAIHHFAIIFFCFPLDGAVLVLQSPCV